MPLMFPSKPDPYVPDEVTKAMARRGSSMFPASASDAGLPGTATAANVPASTRAQIASIPVGSSPAAPAPTNTAPAPTSRVIVNPTSAQAAAVRPSGMTQLAPGVSRSEVPGVYMARGRDGSMMFSNITGPDGQPTFAGSAEEAAAGLGMGRRRTAYAGGSQVDPRYSSNPVAPGWNEGDGAQGGVVDRYAGQVDPNGLSAARGTAGMTWANASGGMTGNEVGNMIDSRTSPFQIQADMQDLATKIHDDPNASNPQVAAANNQAMLRLKGAYEDQLQRFYGGNGAKAAMLGGVVGAGGVPIVPDMGVGTGGGRGGNVGTTIKDIASAHADTENAATNAAKGQASAQLRQQQQDEAARQNIIKTTPPAILSRAQQLGFSPTDYADMSRLVADGNVYASDPKTTALRNRVLRMVMSGDMQARGMSGALGNELHLEQLPYVDVNDAANYGTANTPGKYSYSLGTGAYGEPVMNVAGRSRPLYLTNLGSAVRWTQGDSSQLQDAWNDPVLQQMIIKLAQPSGMDRR